MSKTKRKRSEDDIEYISKKIKKLEKKLSRARRDRDTSQSSNSTPSSPRGESLLDIEPDNTAGTSIQGPVVPEIEDNPNIQELDAGDELEACDQLGKDLLEILGEDPSLSNEKGKEIHKDLATRLEHIAVSGLNKELRKELMLQYVCPANATHLGAPLLNSEIKAALPETAINRDKAIEAKQKLLTCAISCLGSTMSDILVSKDKNKEILKKLMDASRILCDIQHADSMTRRRFSCSTLKKDVKDQIQNTKIDKYLFGENLADTLKAAKAVLKSGAEIKIPQSINNTRKPKSIPKQGNLNWKAPPVRRQPAQQRQQGSKEPAPRRAQHYRPSKTSPYQQKQSRRR